VVRRSLQPSRSTGASSRLRDSDSLTLDTPAAHQIDTTPAAHITFDRPTGSSPCFSGALWSIREQRANRLTGSDGASWGLGTPPSVHFPRGQSQAIQSSRQGLAHVPGSFHSVALPRRMPESLSQTANAGAGREPRNRLKPTDAIKRKIMEIHCFREPSSTPSSCGQHHVPLESSPELIDTCAPFLGQITCLRCPVSHALVLDEHGFRERAEG